MTMPEHILCARRDAGIEVELSYLPLTELTVLTVRADGEQAAATVPPEKALDAFEHPFLYLAPAQVEALGVK